VKRDLPPSLVDRALSVHTISGIEVESSLCTESHTKKKEDVAPSTAENVFATEIYSDKSSANFFVMKRVDSDSSQDSDEDGTATDIYDSLSLDGAEGKQAVIAVLDDSILSPHPNNMCINTDEGAEGYDSESSGEDEAIFHDTERQHLAVLATALGRIRAATKGAKRYRRYQDSIFEARKDGPLALKVRSVEDYDAGNVHEAKMSASDDDASSAGEEEVAEQVASVASDNVSNADSDSSMSQNTDGAQDRAKESAIIVATAVAKRRACNRSINPYRGFLRKLFTPVKRGPLAVIDRSDRSIEKSESNHLSSSSSAFFSQDCLDEHFQRNAPQHLKNQESNTEDLPADSDRAIAGQPQEMREGDGIAKKYQENLAHTSSTQRASDELGLPTTPIFAVFDSDGQNMTKVEAGRRSDLAILRSTNPLVGNYETGFDRVWANLGSVDATIEGANETESVDSVPPSRGLHLHDAESVGEEGACKPDNLPAPARDFQGETVANRPFDESSNQLHESLQDQQSAEDKPQSEEKAEYDQMDKEIDEWEVIANWRQATADREDKVKSIMLDQESKECEVDKSMAPEIVVELLRDVKEAILASNASVQASNDTWQKSNEKLCASVFESIEDSHHFAAYLDKLLTEKINQLEEAIRSQWIVSQSMASVANHSSPQRGGPQPGATPPRARSAPTSPAHKNWTVASRSFLRSNNSFNETGSIEYKDDFDMQDKVTSMVVTVKEWRRLQDNLRGSAEAAEAYRKQVLQLRNVLEVKINEGNASLHQVEVLQRKVREAHDREIQAQKQLRPVTRRIEQVIEEMVELEEKSASLQLENGKLKEEIWALKREC